MSYYRRRSPPVESTGPKIAQITRSKKQGFVTVLSPYNKQYVESLKVQIPYPHRQWNDAEKSWDISETYLKELVDLLHLYYDDVTQNLTTEAPAGPENMFATVFAVLPKDYIDKCYFALAQAVHPDHGGTNELMQQLNAAYQEAKQ